MHLLLFVRVDMYSTSPSLSACMGELPAEVLPPVVDIPHEAFSVRCSIFAVPLVEHVMHFWGISPPDLLTRPCEMAVTTACADYHDLAFRGLTFVPPDCMA